MLLEIILSPVQIFCEERKEIECPCVKMNNLTEFEMATGFVRMALDEFYAHDISNVTGLLVNYWTIVENDIAGEKDILCEIPFLLILTIVTWRHWQKILNLLS